MPVRDIGILDGILTSQKNLRAGPLTEKDLATTLSSMLFEVTKAGQPIVEVRDYNQIAERGPFRYSGQIDTMLREGLIPQDVHDRLAAIYKPGEDKKHVGPSYLRVKGLLTHQPTREYFGGYMARRIAEEFETNPLSKPDGWVVVIPNMTGGVWIGDQTRRELEAFTEPELDGWKVWPATPYMREARKVTDVLAGGKKYVDFVEGLVPPPEDTAAIVCFEELRTASETTKNATDVHRMLGGYERVLEAAVFDYQHPVGVERLKRLNVGAVHAVSGKTFFDVSKELGYITQDQCQTATDWLTEPWTFTRRILPDVERLARK